ncbi:putative pentatricopeptide repeat-containing protein [Glycine soja]
MLGMAEGCMTEGAFQVHAHMIKCGLVCDVFVGTSLLHFYGTFGWVAEVDKVFKEIEEPNIVSWTSLMVGYAYNGCVKEVMSVYWSLRRDGVYCNENAMATIIRSCGVLVDKMLGYQVLSSVIKSGLDTTVSVENSLISMFGNCDSIEEASCVFDDMKERDTILWNSIITVSVHNGHCEKSVEYFSQMRYTHAKTDYITTSALLPVCGSAQNLRWGRGLHGLVVKSGLESNVCVCNSLLSMYSQAGKFEGFDEYMNLVLDDAEEVNIKKKSRKTLGSKFEQFWDLLRGKSEYPSQKILREPESDPHLFSFHFSKAFPNSSQKFTKSFQRLCISMATSPKETSAPGSPAVPSSPSSTKAPSIQEQPEFHIQPIQMIPGQAPVPEKLGVKISENPSLATSPREVDTEMDKKIRSIVSNILKNASVPDADEDVPTSSTPNASVPDVEKDVPTSSAPNAEVLSTSSKERSTEEDDQAAEETPAPRAPEPAPGDLIDLEEVESDEEPITNKLAPGIAERLQSRKGKTPIKRSGRIKTMAQKKSTPITPTSSRRSKVAIPSKKRKEISSSDFDDDVELDVSTSKRAKKSGKKVPENVPDAPLDNISFHSIGNAERWKFVYQRRLALERELGRAALDCKEIMDLITAAGLLKTVTKLGDCYESLVREFIVNIPSDITNRKSDEYQKVFVRGKCVRFSPAVINKYLGRPTDGVVDMTVSEHQIAKEITAKQVQHWPKKGKLSAGKLSVKYAILHRIGAANWVPTNHTSTVATGLGKFLYAVGTKSKFNFGNYIFDQTVKHSESFAVKLPIAFPTVLCGIMLSQHPNILNYTDSVMKRESPLSLHYKLFEGTHVPDIVSTSGKAAASGAVSKDTLIAELKDTCKMLEATIKANTEKKMELERLIERLTDSGIDDEQFFLSNKNKEGHRKQQSSSIYSSCSPQLTPSFIFLLRAGNSNVYGFLEPQSIQRSGQSQFELKSYMKSWMQSSKRDVYLGAYLNGPDNYLKGIINSALKGLDDTPQPKSKVAARWLVVKYFNEVRPLEAERFKVLRIQWTQYYLKVRNQT